MHTNIQKYGGDFRNVLDKEFKTSNNITVASGYASLDVINAFEKPFIEIAKKGGTSRLLLGMAFYEGLGQKKLIAVTKLNDTLKAYDNNSGVFVTNGRRYHGKVYQFDKDTTSNIYVGSSNFSASGTKGNIECTVPILDDNQKVNLIAFLNDLYSPSYSISIDQADITVPGKKKIVLDKVEGLWTNLKNYDSSSISLEKLPKFVFPLDRVAEKEKSNLNVYFGKGRENKKNGKIKPRPWYEIELIASNDLNSQTFYPKGDFLAYTDDGLIIPMRTQGDYFKNIRSKNSLQIFGIWLKGKLEKSGVLKKYEPVTLETLEEYGSDKLTFYKFEEGKYYMTF
ncbi:restriction endonuclease PLD domain-containing protein [Aquimarina megaterium]|uniref:restriction endonuclease PLD domain-containing protein n=1 Tax=Aquimarina megaterium TaxID=1443666 RepID=UPI000942C4FD|nr:restriction endonuclease PLD domain-containing protein [Aquimarina megaterium]